MKKWPAIAVGLAAAGIVFLFVLGSLRKPAGPIEPPPAPLAGLADAPAPTGNQGIPPTALLQSSNPIPATAPFPSALPIAPLPAATVSPPQPLVDGLPPATVLDNMRSAVRQYGGRFNGNPVGTNPEITKALNGGNPKQVKFIPPGSGLRINDQGELIDSWGTPFFFHQLSGTEMEIRSAGPDKIMWTDDDLVIH